MKSKQCRAASITVVSSECKMWHCWLSPILHGHQIVTLGVVGQPDRLTQSICISILQIASIMQIPCKHVQTCSAGLREYKWQHFDLTATKNTTLVNISSTFAFIPKWGKKANPKEGWSRANKVLNNTEPMWTQKGTASYVMTGCNICNFCLCRIKSFQVTHSRKQHHMESFLCENKCCHARHVNKAFSVALTCMKVPHK